MWDKPFVRFTAVPAERYAGMVFYNIYELLGIQMHPVLQHYCSPVVVLIQQLYETEQEDFYTKPVAFVQQRQHFVLCIARKCRTANIYLDHLINSSKIN